MKKIKVVYIEETKQFIINDTTTINECDLSADTIKEYKKLANCKNFLLDTNVENQEVIL
jgi:hypothetical protein